MMLGKTHFLIQWDEKVAALIETHVCVCVYVYMYTQACQAAVFFFSQGHLLTTYFHA